MLRRLVLGLVPSLDLRRTAGCLAWLVRRGLAGRWKYPIAIVAANAAGVTAGASAFGLILVYVRAQAAGRESPIPGIAGFVASHWGRGVAAYALTALGLGVFAATCTYFAGRGALYVARDFHERAVRDAILTNDRGGSDHSPVPMLSPAHGPRHIPGLYARHAATVLRLVLEAILPLVTSVVAMGTLLVLDPLITLSLVPVAATGALCLSRLSAKGARLLRRYQAQASEMAPLLSETLGTEMDDGGDWSSADALLGSSGVLRSTLEALYDQTLLSRQVQLTSRILQVVSVAWLVLLFGHDLKGGATAWSSLLVYLIALRYAWQSLGRLSGLVVEIARFMPSVEICARCIPTPPGGGTMP